jgi:hypothetical protein
VSLSTHRDRAISQLKFLKQHVDLMEPFHVGDYRKRLNEFIDFCDQDDVICYLSSAMHRWAGQRVKDWYDLCLKQNEVIPLPEDPLAAMGTRYLALKLVRQDKVDLRFVVSNLFPGSYLNEKLMHFKRLVVHPLGADMRTLSDGLLARLGDEEWVDVAGTLDAFLQGDFRQHAFGPRAWTDEDDDNEGGETVRLLPEELGQRRLQRAATATPALAGGDAVDRSADTVRVTTRAKAKARAEAAGSASNTPTGTSVHDALTALQQAVEALEDPGDLSFDVAALRVEVHRRRFRNARFLARLDDLSRAEEGLAELCAEVRRTLQA